MKKIKEWQSTQPVEVEDPVGIVVKSGRSAERQPQALAFVWGGKVRPRPSLPYGRWKGIRSAA